MNNNNTYMESVMDAYSEVEEAKETKEKPELEVPYVEE